MQRQTDEERKKMPTEQERDAELVARVRRIRGKFARKGPGLGSEELHRERQTDKEREERLIQGYGP
jgi:hypothetical protein